MPATRKAASVKSEPKKSTTGTKVSTRTAAAPAAQRAATATTAKPKADLETNPTRRSRVARIDPEKRRNYVEVAAYYIAERRGFVNGDETRDWLAAEEEIDRLLEENKLSA
jgi:hypothetical protein